MTFNAPVLVLSYNWMTVNDVPARGPDMWTLDGSNDGATWIVIDNTHAAEGFSASGGWYKWVGPFELSGGAAPPLRRRRTLVLRVKCTRFMPMLIALDGTTERSPL
jgi:hypothetical protein